VKKEFSSTNSAKKTYPTLQTGNKFQNVSNREAQINGCDNIDSRDNIDSQVNHQGPATSNMIAAGIDRLIRDVGQSWR
jgi:hypothetical protein